MDRRTLLAAAGGVALSVAGMAAAQATAFDKPHVGADTVTDLQAGLASPYGLDTASAGSTVGPIASAHLSRIRRLIDTGSYPDMIGRQLRLISGETAEPAQLTCTIPGQKHDDFSVSLISDAAQRTTNLRSHAPRLHDLRQGPHAHQGAVRIAQHGYSAHDTLSSVIGRNRSKGTPISTIIAIRPVGA
ncbi:hypothetical protein ACFXD5_26795 [Streptomyces sp. NPDC059385]|uniref:hypothetical protein n=1 Tax=Streptomyces sp. NPDC059385 TaxID=3346817 RepID=UPI00368C819C